MAVGGEAKWVTVVKRYALTESISTQATGM